MTRFIQRRFTSFGSAISGVKTAKNQTLLDDDRHNVASFEDNVLLYQQLGMTLEKATIYHNNI